MAQRRGGGDEGDGRHEGDSHLATAFCQDGDRRRYDNNTTAMMLMGGHNSNGDGWRDGDGNGRNNGNGDGEAMRLMAGTTAMAIATAIDGVMVTQCRQKAQWQRNGNDVDGLHGGNSNGRRNRDGEGRRDGKVVAMGVLDRAMATAIA